MAHATELLGEGLGTRRQRRGLAARGDLRGAALGHRRDVVEEGRRGDVAVDGRRAAAGDVGLAVDDEAHRLPPTRSRRLPYLRATS